LSRILFVLKTLHYFIKLDNFFIKNVAAIEKQQFIKGVLNSVFQPFSFELKKN